MPAENRLTVHEDMTIYHALDLKQRLMGALEANANLELDLAQVSEIDTAGLQLLILTKREAARLLARQQADTPESKAPATKDANSK